MAAFVTILFVGGLIVVILIGNERQKKKLEMTFGWMGEKLGGGKNVEERLAWGDIGGATISFRMTSRGAGKHKTFWTEVDAEIPEKYPLLLLVRKHGFFDQGKIDRGEMVDVIVGDAAFDNRFLVEAAPAEVARILLDPRERSYLLQLADKLHFDIDTIRTADKPLLRLSVRDWIYDINDAMRACEAMAAIAGRVRDAYAAVESASEVRDVGSPYRPQLDDTEARGAAEARLAEVARVDRLRTTRLANQQAFAVVMVGLFVLFAIIAIVGSS